MPMMKAAVLYGREDVRVESAPVPSVGHGEVRVRIRAALTCGTDVKVYRRGYHARMIRPPAIFGHEFAGVIDEVGQGVANWNIGDRVVAANSAPCNDCYYCRRSLWELCEDLLFLNGAYAEYITVPARIVASNLWLAPDSLPLSHAALAEPLACVVRGMEALRISPGEHVAVLGLGPIGLLFVRMCVLAGARVVAIGRRPERLALAMRLGAEQVFDIDTTGDLLHEVCAVTEGGRGPETVIEAVGTPQAWEQAIALARKAGTVSLFGGCAADARVSLDTHRVHYDELTLLGTFHHTPRAFEKALGLLADGSVPAGEFIQQTAELNDLPSILASLACGDNHAVKCAIVP